MSADNTSNRMANTSSPLITRFPLEGLRRDSTYIVTPRKNAYDLYANIGTTNNSRKLKEALDEGPTLKKFVNKVKFQKKVGAMLMSGREKQINDLKSLCNKACDKLKITPRTRFIRQIGKTHLNLGDECLTTRELNAIISVMLEDNFTNSLNLSGNNLNGSIAHYIDTLLAKNTKIRELDLSENNFADDFLPVLIKTFVNNKYLRTLNLSGNHFTDRFAKCLAELIEKNSSIEYLNLSHNEFREKGGILLGNALAHNTHLSHLDLSWNHLRGKGAESIAAALMKNTDLVSLDVSWNGFGFEGCVAIGHALKHNTTLEELNISNNRIHAPALYEFVKGLTHNKGLLTLKMGHNPVPAIATTPFITYVRDSLHMTVTHIDFSGIVVAHDFQKVLDEIKERRPEFTVNYECMLPVHKGRRRTMLVKENFNPSLSETDKTFDSIGVGRDEEIDLEEFSDRSRKLKRQNVEDQETEEKRERLEFEQDNKDIHSSSGGAEGRLSSAFHLQEDSLINAEYHEGGS